jgi:5-methyltetrahydrofolate--homocysteine methyltransferase
MNFSETLRRGPRPLLWDGGVGTALIRRGLSLAGEPPEAWLLRRPDDVRAVHAEFAAAGADVVQTNSFGLLRHLAGALAPSLFPGLPGSAANSAALCSSEAAFRELSRTCVALAEEGAQERPGGPAFVVASLGPVGLHLGDMDLSADARRQREAALSALAERVSAWLEEAGAAAVHLETCCDPVELRAVLAGVRAGAPRLPVLVSVTLTVGQSGLETPLGVPLARMLKELHDDPPEVVGVNCSLTARRMRPAVEALRRFADEHRVGGRQAPLVLAQPQVGQPAPDCKRKPDEESPERFARDLVVLLQDGADAVGGCCGAQGAHLAAARQAVGSSF